MWGEWFNKRKIPSKFRVEYLIERDVIDFTEKILKEYGAKKPSHEGFVYWAGTKEGNRVYVNSAIAPKAESGPYFIRISNENTYHFIRTLSSNKIVQIAQVHSHPGNWVEHSEGDNEAGFRVDGLLSVVVPNYSKNGFNILKDCGVHLYFDNNFHMLANKFISKHIKIVSGGEKILVDLR